MSESSFSRRLRQYLDETRQDFRLLARKLDVPAPVIQRLLISADDPPQYIIKRLNQLTGKRWNTVPSVPDPFETGFETASLSNEFMKKAPSKADLRADNPFNFGSAPRVKKDDEPKSVHDLFADFGSIKRAEEPVPNLFGSAEPVKPAEPAPEVDLSKTEEGLANLRDHIRVGIAKFGSKTALAREVKVSGMSVTNWLTKTAPTKDNLERLIKVLNLTKESIYQPVKTEESAPAAEVDIEPAADIAAVEVTKTEAPADETASEPLVQVETKVDAEPAYTDIEPVDEVTEEPIESSDAADDDYAVRETADVGTDSEQSYRSERDDADDDRDDDRDDRKPQKKGRAEDRIPEPDRILTCLGEHIRQYMVDNDLTPYDMSECMPRKQADAFRLVWITCGTAFPKFREAKALAETLGITPEEIRIEARLPSRAVRNMPGFKEVAERWGFYCDDEDDKADEYDDEEQEAPAPSSVALVVQAAPAPVVEGETPAVSVRSLESFGLRTDPNADEAVIESVKAAGGILAQRAARGTSFLYTVPDAELTPIFEAGTAVLIDTQGFNPDQDVPAGEITAGWYLIKSGSTAVLRHIVPNYDSFTVSTVPDRPFARFNTLQVIGRASAKIPVIRL